MNPTSFWTFACQIYARPSVENCVLALQNQYGLVVNHLLLIAYLEAQGRELDWVQLLKSEQVSGLLSGLIQPLREYRMQLKAQVPDRIYQDLKALELESERLHIDWLAAYCEQQAKACKSSSCDHISVSTNIERRIRDYLRATDLMGGADNDDLLWSLINDFSVSVTG